MKTKRGKYLNQRLTALGITDIDNKCKGFNTFESHCYSIFVDEYYNLTNKEREELRTTPFDNILISYSTIWGFKKTYHLKGVKWYKNAERIRYNENNRFDVWNPHKNKQERSPKYRTTKGGKNVPFFNGLYSFFIKPLKDKGLSQEQIIQQLRPTFKKWSLPKENLKPLLVANIISLPLVVLVFTMPLIPSSRCEPVKTTGNMNGQWMLPF